MLHVKVLFVCAGAVFIYIFFFIIIIIFYLESNFCCNLDDEF